MMTWGDSPVAEQFPAELHSRIMHATLAVGDASVMGADLPTDLYKKPTGISVSIHLKDIAEGERIFNALSENGTIQMPFEQTFWAARFGMCVDRFGIPWMINCEDAAVRVEVT